MEKLVDYQTIKNFVTSRKVPFQYIETEAAYITWATHGVMTLTCDIPKTLPETPNAEQEDFETNFKSAANANQMTYVVNPLDEPDLDLVLASDEKPFTGNECTLELFIPGEPGIIGRKIAGGYGFTDKFHWGDRVTNVQLVDKNFIYAGSLYPATPIEAGIPGTEGLSWADIMPSGVVLGSQVDEEQPEENRGWRFWEDEGGQGGVDIDPLGGLGKLLSLCYMRVTVVKKNESPATKAAFNAWWGKKMS
jgi:hypothetical protein